MKYLILGGKGQLAQEFAKSLEGRAEVLVADRSVCDLTQEEQIRRVIESFNPDYVLNCAAYNLVDLAEGEGKTVCYAVNCVAPGAVAKICAEKDILFVHFSSDYVFAGDKKDGLYAEEDEASPLSEYGKSKLAGEDLIKQYSTKYLVFRTSWVYGDGIQNFIYKLGQWLEKAEYLNISCDEFSVPTSTKTLVSVTLKALEQGLTGLYHVTNSGFCSRYELVQEYLSLTKKNIPLYPVTRGSFNLPAKRPFFSAMSSKKIVQTLDVTIPSWQMALKEFLETR